MAINYENKKLHIPHQEFKGKLQSQNDFYHIWKLASWNIDSLKFWKILSSYEIISALNIKKEDLSDDLRAFPRNSRKSLASQTQHFSFPLVKYSS